MANSQKPHILYLEDDGDSREMVTFMLGLVGIDVTTAVTSEDAAHLANTVPFDLYLLDGLLPNGNSRDLCSEIRKSQPLTPIIFFSAMGFPEDIQKGLDAGADLYLVKPFMGDLADVILKAILRANMQKCKLLAPKPARRRYGTYKHI